MNHGESLKFNYSNVILVFITVSLTFSGAAASVFNHLLISAIGPLSIFCAHLIFPVLMALPVFRKWYTLHSFNEIGLSNVCMLCIHLADTRMYIFRLNFTTCVDGGEGHISFILGTSRFNTPTQNLAIVAEIFVPFSRFAL
jgi:hypothetical protein